jgi:BirA family biotin operon repressor/biotin-[acetyl-CoA-carboxylase] ligase
MFLGKISYYKEVSSTNSVAFQLAKSGEITNNHVIVAEKQSAGRGRYGKDWDSASGNLFLSLILKPEKPTNTISQISFIAAIAMGETISDLNNTNNDVNLSYKWPNDILLNHKKVSGILLESDLCDQLVNFVVLGLGLNINSHPNDTNYPAINLKELDIDFPSRDFLIKEFLNNFTIFYQKWLDFGFLPIRNLWLEKAYKINQEININLSNKTLKGIFKDLDRDGNLVVSVDGKTQLISSGEIFN